MNRMKETLQGTALLVAVTHGFLAWSLAGANPSWAQDKEALDICLNSEREPVVRVEACRTAAEQGLASAHLYLGNMYASGRGVPQDYAEAVKWYRLAVEQGNASAQFMLKHMCLNPDREPGVRVEACHIAAEQGDAEAQFSLGYMYDAGEGVPQDYGEAVKWYRLAADQGNASAQLNLGVRYDAGEGVPQDYGEAVKLVRRPGTRLSAVQPRRQV